MRKVASVKIETSDAYWKFLYWFFSFPNKEFSFNEIVRKLGVSKTTASRIVDKLVKENFLIKNLHGNVWGLKLNSEHRFNFSRRISYNLSLIRETNVLELINKEFPNSAVVLFGSYRKGDDREESDIDLAVQVLGEQKQKIVDFGVIDSFGYRKNVRVQLNLFSKKNVNENLFRNIVNGIVLEGFLEV